MLSRALMWNVKLDKVEAFVLDVVTLTDDDCVALSHTAVPIVNGWAQANLRIRRPPSQAEQRLFFSQVESLVQSLRSQQLVKNWYYLHKPPGLILRFESTVDPIALVRQIHVDFRRSVASFEWSTELTFASYFEQRELLWDYGRDVADAILTLGADVRVCAIRENATGTLEQWATFTVNFLNHFLHDEWWVWEALGRFQRLRGCEPSTSDTPPHDAHAWLDPMPILPMLATCTPNLPDGFRASVTVLVCLNYLYNQWALDVEMQRLVLARARQLTQPELVG